MTHPTVMDRLSATQTTVSPDRHLLDAIRAWQAGPGDVGLLEYTGLAPIELAALVVRQWSVRDRLVERGRRSTGATPA